MSNKMRIAKVAIRRDEDGATSEVLPSALPVWLDRGWTVVEDDTESIEAPGSVINGVSSGVTENPPAE